MFIVLNNDMVPKGLITQFEARKLQSLLQFEENSTISDKVKTLVDGFEVHPKSFDDYIMVGTKRN